MSEDKPLSTKAKRKVHSDRLTAEPETLELIRKWQSQLEAHFKENVQATRSDIMNVILQMHSENLSAGELKGVWDRCFDPIRFARMVAKRLEDAKERGESISIKDVVSSLDAGNSPVRIKPKRKIKNQGVFNDSQANSLASEK